MVKRANKILSIIVLPQKFCHRHPEGEAARVVVAPMIVGGGCALRKGSLH